MIINHPLSASTIYYSPCHRPCLIYVFDSLCTTSFQVIFGLPLLWNPPLHTSTFLLLSLSADEMFVVGKLADILEDTQAEKFTDKLYVALEDFQLALQKDKAKKRRVKKYCVLMLVFQIIKIK